MEKSSVTAEDFVHEATKVHQLINNGQSENTQSLFANPKTKYYYLVSLEWYKKWKEKTNFRLLEDGSSLSPSDIDLTIDLPPLNEDLVDREKFRVLDRVSSYQPELDYLDYPVKFGVSEDVDYILVREEVWRYIKQKYPDAIRLKRATYTTSSYEERVEVFLNTAEFSFYTSGFIDSDMRKMSKQPPVFTCQLSLSMTGVNVVDLVLAILRKGDAVFSLKNYLPYSINKTSIQILHMNDGEEGVKEANSKILEDSSAKNLTVRGDFLPKNESLRESDLRLSGGSSLYFVVEVKRYHDFFFKSAFARDDDEGSEDSGKVKRGLADKGDSSTSRWNRHLTEVSSTPKEKTKESRMGLTGLKNIGNTCYMNSALQCLSNCRGLTNYILANKYKADKNTDNVLGSKCKVVEAFAGLINRMWYGEEERISPSDFKYEIGCFQSAVWICNLV